MKCQGCGGSAVIKMRQHKLALCADCFPDWLRRRVQHTIERYGMFGPADKVLVAVSGGKDSLALWDMLAALDYQSEGVYIDLGIPHGDYSAQSRGRALAFAQARGLTLHVVDLVATYGASVPEKARALRGRSACSLCGMVKRHEMNRVARESDCTVLATGHNLDDEAATLFGNTLRWQTGYLARQAPVLPASSDGFMRKVKPLCRVAERESAAYALLQGIDYVRDECPFSERATSLVYKRLLNDLESRSPAAKQSFYLEFLKARDRGAVQFQEVERPPMTSCEQCGQPTTAGGLCAFCRLWEV
ncbi:MAG: adenine nucleotide alpha hydrolase family protein [Chloroflexi bacterium]|nr:adenine nucleotide alpha hydrolase family protein [Chloroflexota bacterium]MBU1750528.1 adenine nucleotide alpha hydrolase family protein [Chloroflexota bacterium]MBU1877450.1 adenine nucleotide alpha hydrolase family protein [Chloroflexota bacterium]